METMLEAGATLVSIHFWAKVGSDARCGMSELDAPMVMAMLVLARALIAAGSEPERRTFWKAEDLRRFAVDSGGGRLSANWP